MKEKEDITTYIVIMTSFPFFDLRRVFIYLYYSSYNKSKKKNWIVRNRLYQLISTYIIKVIYKWKTKQSNEKKIKSFEKSVKYLLLMVDNEL